MSYVHTPYTISPFDMKSFKKAVFDSDITVKMTKVVVVSNQVTTHWAAEPSAAEKTTLDGIASAHTGVVEFVESAKTLDGAFKVALYPQDGQSKSVVSHDFTDKTTWYMGSQRTTGETVTDDGNGFYHLAKRNIIDLTHGKITFEDVIEGYEFKVYNNGAEIDPKYIDMEYQLGEFSISPLYGVTLGTITVDYSYAVTSDFFVTIPDGVNEVVIKESEMQFTTDVVMQPVFFELQVEVAPGVWVAAESNLHKNIKDIINIARQGKGRIPRNDILRHDVIVFPFVYDRPVKLNYNPYKKRVRVATLEDKPMLGEWGTITFYTEFEDEA